MEKKKTFCAFCSLECDLAVRMPERYPYFSKDQIMEQDFDIESINQGSICAKGNFAVDYINHPKRLSYAERNHNKLGFDEAFDRIKLGFSRVQEKHGKDSVAVIAGGNLSYREMHLIKTLAKDGFDTDNFGFFIPDDEMVIAGLLARGYNFDRPSFNEIEKCEKILIVGDAFYEHPVIAKKILQARYEERKNNLYVIDPRYSNTAWFADVHLQCHPGAEGLVLMALAKLTAKGKGGDYEKLIAGESVESLADKAGVTVADLNSVAEAINGSERTAIILSQIFGKIGYSDVCSVYCQIIAEEDSDKRAFYPLFINQSIFPITAFKSLNNMNGAGKVLDYLIGGKIKGLLLIGGEILDSMPTPDLEKALKNLEFFCCTSTFHDMTNERADITLASANPLEKDGIYFDLDGKIKERKSLIKPPGGAMPDEKILKELYSIITGSEAPVDSKKVENITYIEPIGSYTKSVLKRAEALIKFKGFASKGYPYVMITKAIASHWADGSLTRLMEWNHEHMNEPVLEIHPDLAKKMNIKDGQMATITSEFGKAKLPVKLSRRIKHDTLAVDYHWPEVRKLLPCRSIKETGIILADPIPVMLGK